MRLHYLIAAPLAAALLFFSATPPQAQEKEPGPVEVKESLEDKVKRLEKRVTELEERIQSLEKLLAEVGAEADQDARRAEGEQMLKSLQGMARVAFAKMGVAPTTLADSLSKGGVGAKEADLKGKYFKILDKVYDVKGESANAALLAQATAEKDGYCILTFNWAGGAGKFHWYEDLADLKKSHKEVDFGDKTTSAGDDADTDEVDVWLLYRKEGRNWTYELQGGMTLKTTVKTVKDDHAEFETQTFMGGNALGDPYVSTIEFEQSKMPEDEVPEAPKPIEKEIECKAGTFDCISYDEGKTWIHKKYVMLIVKGESMELIEFNE